MKKLLTIVLSMVMVMSMTAVSFGETTTTPTYTDQSTVIVTKEYKLTNPGTISPAETFAFSALTCTGVEDAAVGVTKENAPVPTIASVQYAKGEAGSDTAKKEIAITLPTYTGVGIYTYTFTEVDGGTAGVTYRAEPIKLVVTVIEQDGKVRVAAVHTEKDGEAKAGAFDNVYSAGSLTVGKTVTGILGDKQKDFTVKVTFNAPTEKVVREAITYVDSDVTKTISAEAMDDGSETVEITLKDDETVTFTNIPYGVTYSIEEEDYSKDGYTAKYDDNKTGAIDSAEKATTVTNAKGGTVDTGIILDNGLYIVLLAGVAVAAGVFFMKRRQDEYDM